MGDFPNGTTSSTHGLCKATDCRVRCAHTITLAAGCPNFRLQIAAESNNPSPRPVVLKTRIRRAWPGSGFGCGGNKRARSLDAQKVVTWMNLFHIGEESAKSGIAQVVRPAQHRTRRPIRLPSLAKCRLCEQIAFATLKIS